MFKILFSAIAAYAVAAIIVMVIIMDEQTKYEKTITRCCNDALNGPVISGFIRSICDDVVRSLPNHDIALRNLRPHVYACLGNIKFGTVFFAKKRVPDVAKPMERKSPSDQIDVASLLLEINSYDKYR